LYICLRQLLAMARLFAVEQFLTASRVCLQFSYFRVVVGTFVDGGDGLSV
jgi:hypothetical protein